MRILILLSLCAANELAFAQITTQPVRILFIGNSYIYYNDLPEMITKTAASYGRSVQYDKHTPGGYTLRQQAGAAGVLEKIKQGNWNYVVLQEQSEAPAAPMKDVEA